MLLHAVLRVATQRGHMSRIILRTASDAADQVRQLMNDVNAAAADTTQDDRRHAHGPMAARMVQRAVMDGGYRPHNVSTATDHSDLQRCGQIWPHNHHLRVRPSAASTRFFLQHASLDVLSCPSNQSITFPLVHSRLNPAVWHNLPTYNRRFSLRTASSVLSGFCFQFLFIAEAYFLFAVQRVVSRISEC